MSGQPQPPLLQGGLFNQCTRMNTLVRGCSDLSVVVWLGCLHVLSFFVVVVSVVVIVVTTLVLLVVVVMVMGVVVKEKS